MNKSSLPVGIRSMLNWRAKGTLRFDASVQRAEGQWNNLQQSLLIHSVISNFPIPAIYLHKTKENNETVYYVLDGLQRLSTIFNYINGNFPLHSSTPPVVVDDVDYDLGNLYFDDLSEECKDAIEGARLTIFCIEDCTPEDIEELFARLNSSTPLTTIQKTRSVIGSELALWAKNTNKLPFFNQSVNFSLNQARREASFEVLLQTMLLLDARNENYAYKSISMGDVKKYCESIRGTFSLEKRAKIEKIFTYLGEAFPVKHKWLKKSNVPTAAIIAEIAIEQDIESADFKKFIDAFSNMCCEEFEENTGSGNIRRAKTEGRIGAVYKVFLQYFSLDIDKVKSPFYEESVPTDIASVQEDRVSNEDNVTDEQFDFAEENLSTQETKEDGECCELNVLDTGSLEGQDSDSDTCISEEQ